MQRSSYVTREDMRAYSVRFEDNRIKELITWYKTALQKAIDINDSKTIRITLKPREYVEISYANQWFNKRVEGWRAGEVILKDNRVIIPFKKEKTYEIKYEIAWDCNERTIDGFTPEVGFVHIDLRPLITERIKYQEKRTRIQSLKTKKTKKGKKLWKKYIRREKNVCKEIERSIVTAIVRTFPGALHGFEDLDKANMISRKNNRKNLRKRIARVSWIRIVEEIENRAVVKKVNPYLTSKTCSRCGYVNKDLRGQVFMCPRCGLIIDRQKNACVNMYLKMKGFSPSPGTFYRLVLRPLIRSMKKRNVPMRRGRGVTRIGDETDDILPDERRVEVNASQGLRRF